MTDKETETETCAQYRLGFERGQRFGALKVLEWAKDFCETVEGNVTHDYRGDSANANELLAELKNRCGV